MASFEFVCNECNCQWILEDVQEKLDTTCVLCVDCSSNKTKLVGFSQFDDASVLDLARQITALEDRIDALERWADDDEAREYDDADC